MSKKTAYKRRDGRWECRISMGKDENGRRVFRSFYGKSREELLRETLRVLKPGGSFALQDLFGLKSAYGDFQGIIERLQADTVSEIHYADSATEIPIPKWLRVSGMMPGVGIIYGKK